MLPCPPCWLPCPSAFASGSLLAEAVVSVPVAAQVVVLVLALELLVLLPSCSQGAARKEQHEELRRPAGVPVAVQEAVVVRLHCDEASSRGAGELQHAMGRDLCPAGEPDCGSNS